MHDRITNVRREAIGMALLLLVLLYPCLLRAQTATPEAAAAAAAQFERGLAAMNGGRYEVACPALAESVRLEPRPGAIFTLAECEAQWGHHASADAHYADCTMSCEILLLGDPLATALVLLLVWCHAFEAREVEDRAALEWRCSWERWSRSRAAPPTPLVENTAQRIS
jgi:hypothetical protein